MRNTPERCVIGWCRGCGKKSYHGHGSIRRRVDIAHQPPYRAVAVDLHPPVCRVLAKVRTGLDLQYPRRATVWGVTGLVLAPGQLLAIEFGTSYSLIVLAVLISREE